MQRRDHRARARLAQRVLGEREGGESRIVTHQGRDDYGRQPAEPALVEPQRADWVGAAQRPQRQRDSLKAQCHHRATGSSQDVGQRAGASDADRVVAQVEAGKRRLGRIERVGEGGGGAVVEPVGGEVEGRERAAARRQQLAKDDSGGHTQCASREVGTNLRRRVGGGGGRVGGGGRGGDACSRVGAPAGRRCGRWAKLRHR